MYYPRILGPSGGYDFTIVDINQDLLWHELDFSAIVPVNASAMHVHIVGEATSVPPTAVFDFETSDEDEGAAATCTLRPQVINKRINVFKVVAMADDRKCIYRVRIAVFSVLNITVKGWWAP